MSSTPAPAAVGTWTARNPYAIDKVIYTSTHGERMAAPVFMMHATGDGRAPGQELFRARPEPERQMWIESDHYLPPREHNANILAWLGRHLG